MVVQAAEEARHEEHPWTAGLGAAEVEVGAQLEELSGAEVEHHAV